MEEEWRDVVGHEGSYIVSNFGNVVSLERFVKRKNHRGGYMDLPIHRKDLVPQVGTCGYLECKMCKTHNHKTVSIHRLVAIAFIPNPNGYKEVNHVDGNKLNNRSDNLEWCDRGHNVRHSFELGLNHGFLGTDHSKCRFTEDEIYDIRNMWDNKIKSHDIALKYGYSKSAIEHIGRRRLWKHLIEI